MCACSFAEPLCPLDWAQDIINSFEAFELNTSEATLRTFLKVFKHHQQALQSVCDRLSKRLVSAHSRPHEQSGSLLLWLCIAAALIRASR
eukprot:SAG11_NODE_1623_length_4559_cov_2.141480_9_plen_90_part_00